MVDPNFVESQVTGLLARMTLEEKIGQMSQLNGAGGSIPDSLREAIKQGHVGSLLNEVDVRVVNELQQVEFEESRLGIPLLIGRDVIHGFRTALPIPLGQAATWNPELIRDVLPVGESVMVKAVVTNSGAVEADEVVQLYVRDVSCVGWGQLRHGVADRIHAYQPLAEKGTML